MLGHKNAKLVAPKLVNVLFRGTAKFFAGFAKGVALWNFVVGPNRIAVRVPQSYKETSAKQNGRKCRAQRVSAEAVPSTSGRKEEYGANRIARFVGARRARIPNPRRIAGQIEEHSFRKQDEFGWKDISGIQRTPVKTWAWRRRIG